MITCIKKIIIIIIIIQMNDWYKEDINEKKQIWMEKKICSPTFLITIIEKTLLKRMKNIQYEEREREREREREMINKKLL